MALCPAISSVGMSKNGKLAAARCTIIDFYHSFGDIDKGSINTGETIA